MPLETGLCLDSRYEIAGLLGTGGMGEVYRAKDLKLGREVALKVLPQLMALQEDSLARFKFEARVLAVLTHPNIRAIHDLVEAEGLHFAVMEYLEGDTLRHRLARGAMPQAEALAVATDIAEGLAAAHAKGIIHRDLKPENIFFTTEGQVKILDFGLARRDPTGESLIDDSDHLLRTQPGLVMGTASYMAPEQIRGQVLDARCDLFAFGCLFFEMLTGRRPFDGQTVGDIIAGVLKDQPAIPSPGPATGWPKGLSDLLWRCLSKDRETRIQSAVEIEAALRALRGLAAKDGKRGRAPGAAGPVKDETTRAIAMAAEREPQAGSGSEPQGSGGFFARLGRLWPFQRREIDSLAVLPFENASGDPSAEYLAEGLPEGLIERLSQLGGLRVAAWSAASRLSKADPATIGARLGVKAVLLGKVHRQDGVVVVSAELVDTRSGSHLWGATFQRPDAGLVDLQQELGRRIAETLKGRVSSGAQAVLAARPTADPEALRLVMRGRHAWRSRTEEGLRQAVAHFQAALAHDEHFALAYAGLAEAYALLCFLVGVMAPADALPKAEAAAHRALELDPQLAEAHTSLAMVLESFRWDWPAAEAAHRRAIALERGNPNLHHRLGMHLLYRGRFKEARAAYSEALRLDPLSPLFQVGMALPSFFEGDAAGAAKAFAQVTVLAPAFPIAQVMLGLALEQCGEPEEAIQAFRAAHALSKSPDSLSMEAHVRARHGDAEGARGLLAELAALSRRRYVSPYMVAIAHHALGETRRCLELLEAAEAAHCELLVYTGIDPRLGGLREEERYRALLGRIGLG
ncbi:MAG: protein kinase [Holophagaceae bacterium]|nr:protein kinase [Holophagaceae bacterium]